MAIEIPGTHRLDTHVFYLTPDMMMCWHVYIQACNHCGGDISYDDNPIVFCDICNVAVHQQCYEIPRIPDGKW